MTKQQLRRQMKEEFKRHDADELSMMSEDICCSLMSYPAVAEADVILAFWPMPTEPDIRPVIRQLHAQGKTVLLPRVLNATDMEFCPYGGDDMMKAVPPYGILEPTTPAVVPPSASSLMLVPGVAFDRQGHRLGHGCGYYDRYLSLHPLLTEAIAFPFQIVSDVPTESTDITVGVSWLSFGK